MCALVPRSICQHMLKANPKSYKASDRFFQDLNSSAAAPLYQHMAPELLLEGKSRGGKVRPFVYLSSPMSRRKLMALPSPVGDCVSCLWTGSALKPPPSMHATPLTCLLILLRKQFPDPSLIRILNDSYFDAISSVMQRYHDSAARFYTDVRISNEPYLIHYDQSRCYQTNGDSKLKNDQDIADRVPSWLKFKFT
jgi:hypothetical protein